MCMHFCHPLYILLISHFFAFKIISWPLVFKHLRSFFLSNYFLYVVLVKTVECKAVVLFRAKRDIFPRCSWRSTFIMRNVGPPVGQPSGRDGSANCVTFSYSRSRSEAANKCRLVKLPLPPIRLHPTVFLTSFFPYINQIRLVAPVC